MLDIPPFSHTPFITQLKPKLVIILSQWVPAPTQGASSLVPMPSGCSSRLGVESMQHKCYFLIDYVKINVVVKNKKQKTFITVVFTC